jgi:diacylglycerol kinase (ATP)
MVESGRRCAVVVNPVKVGPDFRDEVVQTLTGHGWDEPLWLETTVEDPGRGMVAEAVRAGVELVVAAGGDGTVRLVADGLVGTDIVLGVVPAGTGNLLARNLSIPLTESDALQVVVAGHVRRIDLIELSADDGEPEHFAVMAGSGIDSAIMHDADPALKARLGPAAYFFVVGKALGRLPLDATIQIDGHRPRRRNAMLVLIGNVGHLPGGIDLLPAAEAQDGRLHLFVASPRRLIDWLRLAARIVTRRGRERDTVDSWAGERVQITLAEPDNYELDGDVVGSCTTLRARVVPGAVRVCVPQ